MGRALGGTLAAAVLLLAACGTDASPTSASDASTSSASPEPETSLRDPVRVPVRLPSCVGGVALPGARGRRAAVPGVDRPADRRADG